MSLNPIKRKVLSLYQQNERNLHELNTIFFELTHNCNISCLHCGSDCIKGDDKILDPSSIISTLEEVKSNYNSHKINIVLSGGEPLCYPDIFRLGRKIYDLEFPWGMVTNGYSWTRETINRAKNSGMHSITVSLDGLKDNHNWLRGKKDSFKKATNTIKMLIADPFYSAMDVITCVNKRNLNELDELYQYLKSIGLKSWRFFLISPIGRAKSEPDLFLKKDEFRLLLDKIDYFRSQGEMKVYLSESGYIGCDLNDTVRDHKYFCRAGISVAGIMLNGDILACPNIDRRFKQGNISTDSFVDVWEYRYKQFRNRKWMKTGNCKNCKEWDLCNGNSLHLWDLDKNNTKFCHYDLLHS